MSIRHNFPKAGGFVLSYRWCALGVAFGPPFGAVVSSYPIVGWRLALLLDAPFDGGFVLSFHRFALKALEFLSRLIWVVNASRKMKFGTLRKIEILDASQKLQFWTLRKK